MKENFISYYFFYSKIKYICIIIAVLLFMFLLVNCSGTVENLEDDEETIELLQIVLPETEYYTYNEEGGIYTVYSKSKRQEGYVFYAEGMGLAIDGKQMGMKYPGPIVILVGLEDKNTISSIFVISHSETPGAWEYLVKSDFFSQFEGLKLTDAYLTQNGGIVDSVSGATVSSILVLDTVRDTALTKIEYTN